MLNRFKSVLMNAVGVTELDLQYPNDSNNDLMIDYVNSNFAVEVENKPYSRPSFLGLTAEETQVYNFTNILYLHNIIFQLLLFEVIQICR